MEPFLVKASLLEAFRVLLHDTPRNRDGGRIPEVGLSHLGELLVSSSYLVTDLLATSMTSKEGRSFYSTHHKFETSDIIGSHRALK